jgi:hypothetical protein
VSFALFVPLLLLWDLSGYKKDKKTDFIISDVLRCVNLIWTILLLYVFFLLYIVYVCEMYGSIKFSNNFCLYMRF